MLYPCTPSRNERGEFRCPAPRAYLPTNVMYGRVPHGHFAYFTFFAVYFDASSYIVAKPLQVAVRYETNVGTHRSNSAGLRVDQLLVQLTISDFFLLGYQGGSSFRRFVLRTAMLAFQRHEEHIQKEKRCSSTL